MNTLLSDTSILIVKPDHLGDFALALPSLWEIQQQLQPNRMTILCSGTNHQWSSILPWLPKMISIPHPRYARGNDIPPRFSAIAQALKTASSLGPFDFGMELTSSRHDFLGKALMIAARCKHRRGLKGHYDWLLHESVDLGSGHQRNRMAQRFDSSWKISGNTDPSEFIPAEYRWHQNPTGPILFFPWAGTPAKEWPMESWHTLWKNLDPQPRAILVPEPLREKARTLLNAWGENESALQITSTIRETLQLLQASRGLIAPDTGVSHYAWLTGTPLIQLFAGTGDPHQWTSPGATQLFHEPPTCAPCRFEACHRPTHECMLAIQPEVVTEAVRSVITSR